MKAGQLQHLLSSEQRCDRSTGREEIGAGDAGLNQVSLRCVFKLLIQPGRAGALPAAAPARAGLERGPDHVKIDVD